MSLMGSMMIAPEEEEIYRVNSRGVTKMSLN